MPAAEKALGVALFALVVLLFFSRAVPPLYFLGRPLLALWLLGVFHVYGRRNPGSPGQAKFRVLALVALALFFVFAAISLTSIRMYRDYERNVVPWCEGQGLEPYFMTSTGDSTYPMYGCREEIDGRTTLYLVEYPFDRAGEEARLGTRG